MTCGFHIENFSVSVIKHAPDGVLIIDKSGTIILANPAMEHLTGIKASDLAGKSINVLFPEHAKEEHAALVAKYFREIQRRTMGSSMGPLESIATSRYEISHSSGRAVYVDASLGPWKYKGNDYVVAFLRDASSLIQMENDLEKQVYHDSLTGLFNRRKLTDELKRVLSLAQRKESFVGLLLMDLNEFKEVNDEYGHETGDMVLQAVATRLRGAVRDSDVLFRLGGDEFVILLSSVNSTQDSVEVAWKILSAISHPLIINDISFSPAASLGVSCFPTDGIDAQSLVRFADLAMYKAKREGGNCAVPYNAQMGQESHLRSQIAQRLRVAIEHNQLEMHYQPQITAASGKLDGVEALLRWNDPVLGQVPPKNIIEAIESTELIHVLGKWVIDTTCAQIAKWRKAGRDVRVAMNVSARQFRHPKLEEQIIAAINLNEFPPSLLEVEITESHAMECFEKTRNTLNKLRVAGVKVSLDDFGEGHCNLANLQKLPIERLKFSRDFVRPICERTESLQLLSALVGMAKALGFSVVAEGIETMEQREKLSHMNCDLLQGWLFAKAMPAAELEATWLRLPA